MLTRMIPARAVASCAITHSALFGDQIEPIASFEAERDETRGERVDAGVKPR